MNFRLPYVFTIFLAGLLTFGCAGDPELTVLVQPPGESPLPGGIFLGGQNVTLIASVSYTGGSASEATQLQLYRSEDAAISTDDSPQGERQPVEALMPGGSVDVNVTVTLPSETGSYYYGACITPANSNENCSSGVELMVSESAQAVEPGSMTDSILAAGVSDYFKFALMESARRLTVYTSGETNVTVDLYDGHGRPLATGESSGDEGNFSIERPLAPGTYFIRVNGADMDVTGGYTLHVERGARVTTVQLGSVTDRNLAAGFSDYFQFTLESAQSLVIHTSGGIDTSGNLYDGRGMLLVSDENSGDGNNFYIDHSFAAGTYFIQVSGNNFGTVNGYTLHVIPAVTPGSTADSTLTAGGTDYFAFTLESAQSLVIHTSGGIDTSGNLYDGRGMLLVSDENSGDEGNFRIDITLPHGNYLIEVNGADMNVAGGYTLHVEGSGVTTVQLGSVTDRNLAAGFSDYFQFNLESAQSLAIYTIGESEFTGNLYDGRGMLLVSDENSGAGDNFLIKSTLSPGTYFIEVEGADTGVQGGYTLYVVPAVTPGSTTGGALTAGVSDYFQFTLESPQSLTIYTSGMTNTTGRLYDGDGTLLTIDKNSGDGGNFRIDRLLVAGNYLIEVHGADTIVMGGYTLHVGESGITTIKPGSVTFHTLAAGASDYFKFILESAQNLAIYTSGTTNTTGRLYDSNSMLLTTDENSGDGDNFRIERMLAPGTYFIRVSGDSSSTSGSYTLNIIPMVTPGSMTAASLSAGGSNYFHFTLTGTQGIAVYTSGMTNTTGRLYDANGVLLATNENSGDMSNFRIDLILDMGTYLIRVDGAGRNVMGAYTLHVVGSTVTTVMLGSMTTGMLAAGAGDYFKLTLASDQSLAIYTSGTTDTTGRLYDSDFVLLATNEDSGNFRIDRPLVPGTYFIRVSGNTATVSGAYTLNVTGASVTTATVNPETAPGYTLTAGVSDYFKLTLASAQNLAIYTSGMTDTTGTLYNDSGALLAMAESGGDMSNFRIDRPLAADTYFIRVSGNTATVSGAYTLNITGASVTTVMLDAMNTGTAMGTLAAGGSDYFQLTLTSNRGVVIYTSGMVNTTGSLYNSYGVLLATDENSGDGNNFRIELPLAPGTYFIEVKGADMSAAGAYTLNITVADMATKLTLPSMEGATETSSRTPSRATGTDYFWLEIDTEQTLTIWSSGDIPAADLRITIYDDSANILVRPGNAENASHFRAYRTLFKPGVYFLGVRANNYNRAYTLRIKREADG